MGYDEWHDPDPAQRAAFRLQFGYRWQKDAALAMRKHKPGSHLWIVSANQQRIGFHVIEDARLVLAGIAAGAT